MAGRRGGLVGIRADMSSVKTTSNGDAAKGDWDGVPQPTRRAASDRKNPRKGGGNAEDGLRAYIETPDTGYRITYARE